MNPTSLHLRGVRVHNLKSVDIGIPLRQLTVFTGVSGAGKSSLAFDTLYAEAQRRYLQSFSAYTRQFLDRLDQPDADFIDNLPPAIAVGPRALSRGRRATVGTLTEIVDYLRLLFARAGTLVCPQCGQDVRAHQPADILDAVAGLPAGTRFAVGFPSRPENDVADWLAGLQEDGFVRVQIGQVVYRLGEADSLQTLAGAAGSYKAESLQTLAGAAGSYKDDSLQTLAGAVGSNNSVWVVVDRLEAGKGLERLTDSVETALARGHGRMAILTDGRELVFDQRLICPRCDIAFPDLEPRLFSFNDPLGACATCEGTGIVAPAKGSKSGNESTCPACQGTRLNDQAGIARIGGKAIGSLCGQTVTALADFFSRLELADDHRSAGQVLLEQINARLNFLRDVEVGYLTLNRPAQTLSTGEAQRIRLTTALASNLVHALYVIDEPTAGLHARDTAKLLMVLKRLRDAGNTLVLVEHDLDMATAADHIVDLGPGAGEEGGEVLYQGPPAGLVECADSLTGAYISGRRFIGVPSRRRQLEHGNLRLLNACTHNLHNLTVDFPLGVLCAVTGVSGAGKSALVRQTLYPALCRRLHKKCETETDAEIHGSGQVSDVVLMDQSPLTRTARSNPATYLKVFEEIRGVFADTSEARIHNFGPSAFSFNQAGGRCETCEGQGSQTVDMQFLADVTVACPDCHGTRFKPEILQVKVRNLNIAEVLNLTAREAFRFFRGQPRLERRLKWLLDVGLDYLRLGQPLDTLSGGECQRLKLAGHLASTRKPRCLFLLLEPTAGLHLADIVRLLDCLHRLLDTGHSVILVEHHLDVIKCADHVIDLGPGAAAQGGRVVASGTPEEVARVGESATGTALRKVLNLPISTLQ